MADPVLPSSTPAVISRAEAKALGLKRYFIGKPCPQGHVAERFVVNYTCIVCWYNNQKERIAANREQNSAYHQVYYKANKDKIDAQASAWKKANPERRREIVTASRKNNPESYRVSSENYRALKLAAQGNHTVADIKFIYKAQDGRCKYCYEKVGDKYHIYHRQPLSRGGSNWPSNLQILCPTCNRRKHAKDPIDYEWENGYCYDFCDEDQ